MYNIVKAKTITRTLQQKQQKRYLLIESCDPLQQVGVLMQTQIIDMLLNAAQHFRERGSTVYTRVQRLHLKVNLFLNSNEVVHTLMEEEDHLRKSLDVWIQLVWVPGKLDTFRDQCLDITSHPSHQQTYTWPLLHLPTSKQQQMSVSSTDVTHGHLPSCQASQAQQSGLVCNQHLSHTWCPICDNFLTSWLPVKKVKRVVPLRSVGGVLISVSRPLSP